MVYDVIHVKSRKRCCGHRIYLVRVAIFSGLNSDILLDSEMLLIVALGTYGVGRREET
jgi:hypothetical protein